MSETAATYLDELKTDYDRVKQDAEFSAQLDEFLCDYLGQPTPLFFAKRFAERLKGAKIYLKREDLNYTGSFRARGVAGQALLAKKLGRREIVVESASGEQAIAAASVARHLGLRVRIYANNIFAAPLLARLKVLGAEIFYKENYQYQDLVNACFLDWLAAPLERYYIPAWPLGPHPLPEITRDFQSFSGLEIFRELSRREKQPPAALLADSALALGVFYPFINTETELVVVEPAFGAADLTPLADGKPAVFQGAYTKVLRLENGQAGVYASPCADLNYPAAPPELAYLHSAGRLVLRKALPEEMQSAAQLLLETEGLTASPQSLSTLAELLRRAPALDRGQALVGVLSGKNLEFGV
ncbi:MAG: pyridoxal-phosphate dependent enzyme [Candidatus Margulisbacteria bacterium]|nr:pyridoxal-phosphate dependent enzyme [Candidatus Margulisiibacteriota bacterium]